MNTGNHGLGGIDSLLFCSAVVVVNSFLSQVCRSRGSLSSVSSVQFSSRCEWLFECLVADDRGAIKVVVSLCQDDTIWAFMMRRCWLSCDSYRSRCFVLYEVNQSYVKLWLPYLTMGYFHANSLEYNWRGLVSKVHEGVFDPLLENELPWCIVHVWPCSLFKWLRWS